MDGMLVHAIGLLYKVQAGAVRWMVSLVGMLLASLHKSADTLVGALVWATGRAGAHWLMGC